jgi:hypothetical protein
LHETEKTAADAARDEKIISQLHSAEVKQTPGLAGRFALDVRQK